MKAYKTYSTVSDLKQVILSDVPFRAGEKVEIVVLTTEDSDRSERVRKLKNLFRETQSLPQIQTLSEDDILREVEAYRNGR
jgi:predicted DNA-binding antitoxin AbrB/MazE fold protein